MLEPLGLASGGGGDVRWICEAECVNANCVKPADELELVKVCSRVESAFFCPCGAKMRPEIQSPAALQRRLAALPVSLDARSTPL